MDGFNPCPNLIQLDGKPRNLVSSFSGKLVKIVATRCHILRRKYTKFNFGWGSGPDPAGGAYSAPPHPLAGI